MRRVAAILLTLCFLALGSGVAGYWHDAQHAREDVAAAARGGRPVKDLPVHNENNCRVHAVIHAPVLSQGWVPLLVLMGVFVAFLTLIAPAMVSQAAAGVMRCRGPPSLA